MKMLRYFGPEPAHGLRAGGQARPRMGLMALLVLALIFAIAPCQSALAQAGALALDVAASDDPVVRGQRFFYRVTVTNPSELPMEDVTVQLLVPQNSSISRFEVIGATQQCSAFACGAGSLLTLTIGTLQPGVSREVQVPSLASSNIPAADLPYPIQAEFVASHPGSGANTVAQSHLDVVFSKSLDVQLAASPAPVSPMGEAEYRVFFGNNGSVAAANLTVDLDLPEGVEVLDADGGSADDGVVRWAVSQLNAGRSDFRRVRVRDVLGGESRRLVLSASISDGGANLARTGLITPARTTMPLSLDLSVSDDPVVRGQRFFYRLRVSNTDSASANPLEGVSIQMVAPENTAVSRFEIVGAAQQCSAFACGSGSLLTLNLGTLKPGESHEVQIPVVVNADSPFGRLIAVQLWGTYLGNPRERPVNREVIVIQQSKPLDVKLATSPMPGTSGSEFEYLLMFGNNATQVASDSRIELRLPAGVDVLDSDAGVRSGQSVIWLPGQIGPGRGDRFRVRVRDSSGQDVPLAAEALLDASTVGADWFARSQAAATTHTTTPLSVSATSNRDPLQASDTFEFRLNVTNTNPPTGAPMEDVTVRLVVPQHTTALRFQIIGASQQCSAFACGPGSLLTLTVGTLQPGETRAITIPATVATATPDGSLIDGRFVATAAFPNAEAVQQAVTPLLLLVGQYLPAAPTTAILAISRIGTGSGTVASVPSGINCGLSCTAAFALETSVTLTATPAQGSEFSGWSGACAGTATSCIVTMSEARAVIANFSTTTEPVTPGPEERSNTGWQVSEIYIATLGYAPDSEGLQYWISEITTKANWTPLTVAQSFFDQPLVQAQYPEALGFGPLIDALYVNLFARPADAEGLAYWLGELQSGRLQRNQMIIALINGGWDNQAAAADMARFGNRVRVAQAFADYQSVVGIQYSQLSAADQSYLRTAGQTVMLNVTADPASIEAAITSIPGLLSPLL